MAATPTTPHTHQVVFGRREAGCPRCTELSLGMPARQWRGYRAAAVAASLADARRIDAIRSHDCRASRCGSVCTYGDY